MMENVQIKSHSNALDGKNSSNSSNNYSFIRSRKGTILIVAVAIAIDASVILLPKSSCICLNKPHNDEDEVDFVADDGIYKDDYCYTP